MRVSRIKIRNLRSIQHLAVDLGDATVFVGLNNAGKTAILDALSLALKRRWGQCGTGFSECAIHPVSADKDPQMSSRVTIELWLEEPGPREWPNSVAQALAQIVQLNVDTGVRSIALWTPWAWSDESGTFEASCNFLNVGREPLTGRGARRINLERFWRYVPAFYLGALRDVRDEVSARSQFWGRLLKALEIPTGLESRAERVLDLHNRRLLKADRRLEQIAVRD